MNTHEGLFSQVPHKLPAPVWSERPECDGRLISRSRVRHIVTSHSRQSTREPASLNAGHLRHAAFISLRQDKIAWEVIREPG